MQLSTVQQFIRLAGIGQIALAIGSTAIPGILKWQVEMAKVQPLIKQIFWTYACYILVFNLSFGLVSAFDYRDLTDGTTLATLVTGFITVYWVSRVMIQFFYFDRANFPTGMWPKIGETVLVTLFITLTLVYAWACYNNFSR